MAPEVLEGARRRLVETKQGIDHVLQLAILDELVDTQGALEDLTAAVAEYGLQGRRIMVRFLVLSTARNQGRPVCPTHGFPGSGEAPDRGGLRCPECDERLVPYSGPHRRARA